MDTFRLSEAICRWGIRRKTACLLRDHVSGHVLSDRCSSRVVVNNVPFGINVYGVFKLSVAAPRLAAGAAEN